MDDDLRYDDAMIFYLLFLHCLYFFSFYSLFWEDEEQGLDLCLFLRLTCCFDRYHGTAAAAAQKQLLLLGI